MFRRVFSKKGKSPTTSKTFRIPDIMLEKLEHLAEEEGETLNAIVVLILDQYLQAAENELQQPAEPGLVKEPAS